MNDRPTSEAEKWLSNYDDNSVTLDAYRTMQRLERQRDELLDALSVLVNQAERLGFVGIYWDNARAAISAVKGGR